MRSSVVLVAALVALVGCPTTCAPADVPAERLDVFLDSSSFLDVDPPGDASPEMLVLTAGVANSANGCADFSGATATLNGAAMELTATETSWDALYGQWTCGAAHAGIDLGTLATEGDDAVDAELVVDTPAGALRVVVPDVVARFRIVVEREDGGDVAQLPRGSALRFRLEPATDATPTFALLTDTRNQAAIELVLAPQQDGTATTTVPADATVGPMKLTVRFDLAREPTTCDGVSTCAFTGGRFDEIATSVVE
jgi:hypothetical protein